MELSEKEIEDFIYDDLTINDGMTIIEKGIELSATLQPNRIHWERQLNIDPYGICDIVGFYRLFGAIHVELIELKKVNISPDHFEQLFRYRKGIDVYLRNTFKGCHTIFHSSLIGFYDGLYLQNYSDVTVYGLSYDLNGLQFERHEPYSSWHIIGGKDKSFRHGKKVH